MEILEVMKVKGVTYAVCKAAFAVGFIAVSEYVSTRYILQWGLYKTCSMSVGCVRVASV